jgi:hypothetical protein
MRTSLVWPTAVASLTAGVLLGWWAAGAGPGARAGEKLPRFTEEREAAALFFVKKHLPDLLPLLEELKKSSADRYRREVREIFHATELLADLGGDGQRHDLELKIWVAENRAQILIAKLSTPSDGERKKAQGQLHELARQLVDLDIDVLDLKAERLDRELGEVKDEVARIRENRDKYVKDRYDGLLQRVQKRKR